MDGVSPRPDEPGISRGPEDGATRSQARRIPRLDFAFDYVDPGSYLAAELLRRRISAGLVIQVDWMPLELRAPSERPQDPNEPAWLELTRGAVAAARPEGIEMLEPRVVPWTRKAHELGFLARERGLFDAVHRRLFEAHFRHGLDIGRIDVLVALGEASGLEAAETRTVLGIDRFSAAVAASAEELSAMGIRGVPTLWTADARLEGLQSVASFDSFLTSVGADAQGVNPSEEREKWLDT